MPHAYLKPAPKMASQSNSSHLAVQSVLPENNTILESKTWSQVINRLSDKKQEQMAQTIANLENQLDQQQKLSDMYREQVSAYFCMLLRGRLFRSIRRDGSTALGSSHFFDAEPLLIYVI